jgi:hypothetical protein
VAASRARKPVDRQSYVALRGSASGRVAAESNNGVFASEVLAQAYTILMVVRESCARNRRCPRTVGRDAPWVGPVPPLPRVDMVADRDALFPWEDAAGSPFGGWLGKVVVFSNPWLPALADCEVSK